MELLSGPPSAQSLQTPLDCQGKGWLSKRASSALVVWAILPLSCAWMLSTGPLCAALSYHGSLSLSPCCYDPPSQSSVFNLSLMSLCSGGLSQHHGCLLPHQNTSRPGSQSPPALFSEVPPPPPAQAPSSVRAGTAPVLSPLCPQYLLCDGDSYKAQQSG